MTRPPPWIAEVPPPLSERGRRDDVPTPDTARGATREAARPSALPRPRRQAARVMPEIGATRTSRGDAARSLRHAWAVQLCSMEGSQGDRRRAAHPDRDPSRQPKDVAAMHEGILRCPGLTRSHQKAALEMEQVPSEFRSGDGHSAEHDDRGSVSPCARLGETTAS